MGSTGNENIMRSRGNCQLAKKVVLFKKVSKVTIFDGDKIYCFPSSYAFSMQGNVRVSLQMPELHLAHTDTCPYTVFPSKCLE